MIHSPSARPIPVRDAITTAPDLVFVDGQEDIRLKQEHSAYRRFGVDDARRMVVLGRATTCPHLD
ncbi:MAG: hypothetical protein AAGJ94_04470 [Pseudomonadota bacterium]